MSFEWFKNRSYIMQVIFILILLYAASSFVVLAMALGVLPLFPRASGAQLNPYICLIYAMVSFVLTIFISAFHLSTMIRRRKRRDDPAEAGQKAD